MTISADNDRLTIIINKKLKLKIKELADKENRSMGNYINHILENHVKEIEQNKTTS